MCEFEFDEKYGIVRVALFQAVVFSAVSICFLVLKPYTTLPREFLSLVAYLHVCYSLYVSPVHSCNSPGVASVSERECYLLAPVGVVADTRRLAPLLVYRLQR